MSWHPNDLVADQDLVDYEQKILSQFGQSNWLARRTKVIEDWILPILRANGFDPFRFRTRFEPDKVWGYTAAAYTDYTAAAGDVTEDDVNLASVFATPANDVLYVGSRGPFRGLHWRLLENVSSVANTLTVSYWNDQWTPVSVNDATSRSAGKPFSAGGSMTWPMVADWVVRTLSGSDPLYWVKVGLSAVPTGAKTTQIGCIRRSALCAPATLRTLMLIFKEASTQQDGPWKDKADYYEKEADLAMQRALPILGGEFDTDDDTKPSDLIGAAEASQTTAEATGGGAFRLERG